MIVNNINGKFNKFDYNNGNSDIASSNNINDTDKRVIAFMIMKMMTIRR